MKKRLRCYYCHRFISVETALRNWMVMQAPGVMDPEPYEIMWCANCDDENGPDSATELLERGPR